MGRVTKGILPAAVMGVMASSPVACTAILGVTDVPAGPSFGDLKDGGDAFAGSDDTSPNDGSPDNRSPDNSSSDDVRGDVIPQGDDGGPEADGAALPPNGKLILVHASAYTPALRFCFGFVHAAIEGGAGTITMSKTPALPNTLLGVPPGAGDPTAAAPGDGLAAQTIEVYAIDATKLATAATLPDSGSSELTCDALIGPDAVADAGIFLTAGSNYWPLGQLPAGTFVEGTTTLVAVVGCAPGAPDPPYNCPSPYSGSTGNLALWYKTLDTTTVIDGGSIGAQFAFLSYPFSSANALSGGVAAVAGFYVQTEVSGSTTDAGPQLIQVTTPVPVAGPVVFGDLKPASLSLASGITFDGTSGFFVSGITADGGPAYVAPQTSLKIAQPLSTIHDQSWGPGSDAGVFQNGNGYVFILLGDPDLAPFIGPDGGPRAQDAGGTFNPWSAHILGFPTNPPYGK